MPTQSGFDDDDIDSNNDNANTISTILSQLPTSYQQTQREELHMEPAVDSFISDYQQDNEDDQQPESVELNTFEFDLERTPQPREELQQADSTNPTQMLINLLKKKRSIVSQKSRFNKNNELSPLKKEHKIKNMDGRLQVVDAHIARVRAQQSSQTQIKIGGGNDTSF